MIRGAQGIVGFAGYKQCELGNEDWTPTIQERDLAEYLSSRASASLLLQYHFQKLMVTAAQGECGSW